MGVRQIQYLQMHFPNAFLTVGRLAGRGQGLQKRAR